MKVRFLTIAMAISVATFAGQAQEKAAENTKTEQVCKDKQKQDKTGNADAQKSGKKAEKAVVTFYIANMHGEHCQSIIEKNIGLEKGVKDLQFNLETNKVKVIYNPAKTNTSTLKAALEKLGYEATIVTDNASAEVKQVKPKCCASH
jgi:copper chaperone CopZ